VSADAASRTAFRHLRRGSAISLAVRDFYLNQLSWAPPGPVEGAKIERYVGASAAVERLRGGQHVLVSSTTPLRTESEPGHPLPVSLALRDDGEGYVPVNPLVPLAISKRAQSGISFPSGLSVTPVSAETAETPAVVGNSVVFANASSDTDLIEEPLPNGAEMSWQLRSQDSSPAQGLKFDLPPGATLRASRSVPGGVEVREEDRTVIQVPPASAEAANGVSLATSYSISGDVLTTHVDLSGNVAFPVLLDPALYLTYYGENDGAGSWAGWQHYLSSGYGLSETGSELEVYANEGEAYGSYGSLYIYPPGPLGLPGSAGITRVNLYTVGHGNGGQSDIQGEIAESNGPKPAYTIEPNNKEYTTEGPLNTPNNYVHQTIAFCAQEANGSDKEEQEGKQPLCNEIENQGKYFFVNNIIDASPHSTVTSFTDMKEAEVIYRDPTAPNRVVLNHPGYEGQWLKTGPTNWSIEAEDEGTGLHVFEVQIPAGNPEGPYLKQVINCTIQAAQTTCPRSATETINLSGIKKTGPLSVDPVVQDLVGNYENYVSSRYVELYLDQVPPEIGELTGTLGQAANHIIGDGNYTLGFSAVDGSKASPQSGVKSLEVKVDGKLADTVTTSCPQPKGPPAEGCYALSGSWTMSGQAYGAGSHKITVVAKDWAGNESEQSFYVTVNEAAYEPVGPGAVNLQTGDFKLSATDVSLSGGLANLSVSRAYDSRNLTQGSTGPLGPQWLLSLPDSAAGGQWQSLSVLANGSVALNTAQGEQVVFAKAESGYTSPGGYQTDTLTEPSTSPAEYEITDGQGDSTRFTQPSSGAAFLPSKVDEATAAGGLNKVTYSFTTKEGITEPTEVLAPEPSEGACTAKLVQGCRALTFTYATSKTASGEAKSEWGEYPGRLSKVSFIAWEPSKGEMSAPIVVAQYAYDAKGRLRAEWDPRIPGSTRLETTYGYDSEGHVTAVSSPGQEPWLLHYGASASDSSTGRLLSASRFNAETALWKGEALTNSVVPKLSSTTPVVGTAVSAGTGTWSTTSVVYGYQWERCTSGVKENCSPIAGATNQTYTPVMADLGHGLSAMVTATNAFGSVTVETAVSSNVVLGAPAYSPSFGSSGSGAGQFDEPTSTAVAPNGNVWVADAVNHRLQEFSPSGSFIEAIGWGVSDGKNEFETCTSSCKAGLVGSERGEFSNPEGLAINPSGDIYVADSAQDRIQELSSTGTFITAFGSYGTGEGDLWDPHGVAVDGNGNVWVADTNNCRVDEFSASGTFRKAYGECGKTLGKFEGPFGVADPFLNLYVTDIENQRVEELDTTSKTWLREFGNTGSETEKLSYPWAIAADPFNGDLYVTSLGDSHIQAYTPEGKYVESFGAFGSGKEDLEYPTGISVSPTTGAIYIADEGNNRVDVWAPNAITEEPVQPPPNPGTTSVTTIEYQVPASGTGAPHALGSKETAEWAQKDDPGEGTAIFPASEPQGWPASEYKHATIYYLDSVNHVVNIATPSGGISTAEYNEANSNVERTLSADNRVAALKEGSKSAETAKQLQSETTYNTEGTQVTSTLGPQHTVKLATNTEVQARKHTQYLYEENAPEKGHPYNLVTKTIEAAKLATGEEKEQRTVTTNYNGQENLGWQLHEPTSVETSTGNETLTSTTTYERSTGAVSETQTPVGSLGDQGTFISQFGTEGAGHGQFKHPADIAIDSKGNRWVIDEANDRVEEFNENNEFLQAFGEAGPKLGQLSEPTSLAVGANGDVWVADGANDRVAEFSEKGTPIEVFGYGVTNGKEELQTCTSSCKAGVNWRPETVAVDSHGNVWVGSGMALQAYNEKGEYQKAITLPRGARPESLTFDSHGNLWLVNVVAREVEEYNEKGEIEKKIGHAKSERALSYPVAVTVDSRGNVWVADSTRERILQFNAKDEYVGSSGSEGSGPGQVKLTGAVGIATDGQNGVLVTDSGNDRIEKWLAPNPTQGNASTHTTQTIYYSTAANSTYPNCGKHSEWAGLPCQEQPAAQPESGLPKLAISSYTYNIWDEPLTTTDTVGTGSEKKERTTTLTYDAAGRPVTSAIASTIDKAVPTVTDEYNSETGALKKQSTNEGKTSITSEYNMLGQLTAYTDAGEKTTTYEYEKEKEDRLIKVSDSKGSQTLGYEANTGFLTSLKDSAPATFSATHDVEGNIITEGYPNGMNANYTYNAVGQPVALEYVKTTHCTTGCTWYTDKVAPSVRGEWLSQTSSLSSASYFYDQMGRLTEVQETPAGKGCASRLYAYDEDDNRTSLTTREPGSEGKCATEGGTSQSYDYDTADRLDESGITYESFGNITSLPAVDAGGSTLTSSYYVDNALAAQEQNGEKISYNRDPDGRPLETISTGTTESTITSHYDGPGDAPAWTATSSGGWTRNIVGINGALAAIQTSGKEPILQLADLHGDIIGTAAISETESKVTPANETSEYGVPRTSIAAKYSWLGADALATELPTGIISMGARTYIPELGRFLQTDPQPGGSGNAYAYTDDDPVNESDPSGEYTSTTTYNYEAAETGAGAGGPAGEYEAPGAILPPPVNLQIEAEFVSYPPLSAASAFEEGGGEGWMGLGAKAASAGCPEGCYGHRGKAGGNPFAEAWHWVTSNAKKLVAAATSAVSTAVIAGVTIVATTGCAASAALTADPFEAFDCYKIATFGVTLSMAAATSTVAAWKLTKG